MLSADQICRYQELGYVLLPRFKSPAELAGVRERAWEIARSPQATEGASLFTTRREGPHVDRWFLDSAHAVRCFFEQEAFSPDGRLKQALELSINKIGHALHDLDPTFDAFSHGPELAAVAHDLGLVEPQIRQSMVIFKPPGIGGEVGWHQDASFFVTDPVSVTTFWFALEDATLANGCLWVEPGGHAGARGVLRERFEREGDVVRMQRLSDLGWPDQSMAVPIEVSAGDLLCFHGLLPHYSAPNRSARSRLAYTLHVTDGRTAYAPTNWIQAPAARTVRGFT
jgi:phytanoyl-CoA hydroxylase